MFDQITMSHRTFSLTLAAVTGERRKVISGSPLVSGSCPLLCTAENTSCASMVVNSGQLGHAPAAHHGVFRHGGIHDAAELEVVRHAAGEVDGHSPWAYPCCKGR